MNVEIDFGPFVSLLLNSLLLTSLGNRQHQDISGWNRLLPQDLISQLWIVILFSQDLQKLSHRFRKMVEVGKALHNRRLGSCTL